MAAAVVTRNPTTNPRGNDVWGHYGVVPFDYAGNSSYQAGGDVVTAGQFKLGVLEWIPPFFGTITGGTTTGVLFVYNPTTGAIQAYQSTTGAPAPFQEVANGTDLSTVTAHGMAFGKG